MSFALLVGISIFPTAAFTQARGLVIPEDAANRLALQGLAAEKYSALIFGLGAVPPKPKVACSAKDARFDLRTSGMVPPAGDQGPVCGSCWAFASASAIETSYAFFNAPLLQAVNLSEQELLECSKTAPIPAHQAHLYNCTLGGFFDGPFEYAEQPGVLGDAAYVTANGKHGYQGQDGPCVKKLPGARARVANWGPISSPYDVIATTAAIKESLCAHGGVVTGIDTYNWPGYGFTGDIFIGEASVGNKPTFHVVTVNGKQVSTAHAVQIVGWDDTQTWTDSQGKTGRGVWLIKNSWGNWADNGVIKIPYNRQSVGAFAAWVSASLKVTLQSLPINAQAEFLNAREQIRLVKTVAPNFWDLQFKLDQIQ